jgi:putative SOS response-associated peptidase YedK
LGLSTALKGKSGQPLRPKTVNNTRSDELTSPFWRDSFEHRRCLIPMNSFAEAEGKRGHKTRT